MTDEIINACELICEFPYANAVYTPIKPLEKEYRKIFVKNHTVFYTVDEQNKKVIVTRVIYSRRNIDEII